MPKKEAAGKRLRLAWETDRVQDKTSLEVLLDWLQKSKNYARWSDAHRGGSTTKVKLGEEINRRMRRHGITYRTVSGITRRMYGLLTNMASANELLAEEEMDPQVGLDECNECLKSKMLQICPHFEQLAPVVNGSRLTQESASSKRSAKKLSQEEIRERLDREEESAESFPDSVTGIDDDYGDCIEEEATNDYQEPERTRSAPVDMDDESSDSPTDLPDESEHYTVTTGGEGRRSRIFWGKDHVEGVSSIDIVLGWLATGNNYARWKGEKGLKMFFCREINTLLRAQGIYHRTNVDIRDKITRLEYSVAKVKKILSDRDLGDEFSLKDCETSLRNEILHACPYFEFLSPLMVEKSVSECDEETAEASLNDEEAHEEDVVLDLNTAEAAEEVEHEISAAEELEDEVIPATEEVHQDAGAKLPIPAPEAVVPKQIVVRVADFKLSPLQQQQLEQRCSQMELDHERASIQLETLREIGRLELEAMRARGEFEMTSALKKRDIELESAQAQSQQEIKRHKCDLESIRARNEYALVVERELARQKLRRAGIPQAEVDRLLPSKQLAL